MAHQQASQRHGQRPAGQTVECPFTDKKPVDASGRRTHRSQDGQLAASGGRIHGHQAVDQKHAHEEGGETQEGQVDLVGANHVLPAGFDAPGRSDLEVRADGGRRFGGEPGIRGGQLQVDAIDPIEGAREFLEGGNVTQGHSSVGQGAQALRGYPPHDGKGRVSAAVGQYHLAAGIPPGLPGQRLTGQKREGLGHDLQPGGLSPGRPGFLPGAHGAIHEGVDSHQ